ncbi:MAG TPA: hypothetical protein VMV10_08575 [Pirellulales bacterium]|nr:hypothetical protein [Pirellulales bacterium]
MNRQSRCRALVSRYSLREKTSFRGAKSDTRPSIRWNWLLLAAACWIARPSALEASGFTNIVVDKSGFGLSVQTEWLDGGGYRPVRITIKPPKPSPGDRSFHVEFHAKNFSGGTRETAASRDIDLPAGVASVTATLLVPQQFTWQWFDMFVWEDGVHLKPLDMENVGAGSAQDWPEGLPHILLAADPPPVAAAPPWGSAKPGAPLVIYSGLPGNPDSSSLAALLPTLNGANGYAATPALPAGVVIAPQLETLVTVPLDQLPESWLAYSGLDLICLSFDQARQLAAKDKTRWQAIRAWTVAGGNLLISDLGDDLEKLAAIDRLLGEPQARWQIIDPAERGWQTPQAEWFNPQLPAPFGTGGGNFSMPGAGAVLTGPGGQVQIMAGTGNAGLAPPAAQPTQPAAPTKPAFDPAYRYRKHGLGMLVAVSAADLMAQSSAQWAGILNALSPERWAWYRRHGVSPQLANDDFWNLPVLGVGLAPVTAFQVLITGFVIAIGPLNYWWLRRRGKLHLLVVVVPLSAAAVTLTLLAYAVASDGFGVRVRVRSFTEIDQRRGEAACWSRIAYYAGLAPGGGLKFDDTTAVIPLDSQGDYDSQPASLHRGLIWTPQGQELVSGWLPSRTPVQLLTVRSRPTTAGLRIVRAPDGSSPSIENRLQTRIEQLLLADEEGQCFSAAGIEAGAKVALTPADLPKVGEAFRKILVQTAPGVPPGLDRRSYGFSRGYNTRWQSPLNNSLPAASLASSLLERGISDVYLQVAPGYGRTGGLPPRTYAAIVSRSPETDYGVEEVEEAGSLHVILGKW